MPQELYDAEGNAVTGVYLPDEVEPFKKELEEAKIKLTKLENKDYNFRKLQDMTEEERKKLSVTELELKKQQEKLEEEQQNFRNTVVAELKDDVLYSLVGDDKALRDKILYNFDRIKGSEQVTKRSELVAMMREARDMLGGASKNPLTAAINYDGGPTPQKGATMGDDFLGMANKNFGISKDDFEKYSNK